MSEFRDPQAPRRAPFVAVAIVVVLLPLVFALTRTGEPAVPVPSRSARELLRVTGQGTMSYPLDAPAGTAAIAVTVACRGDDVALSTTRRVVVPCGSGAPSRVVLPADGGPSTLAVRTDAGTRFAVSVVATDDSSA